MIACDHSHCLVNHILNGLKLVAVSTNHENTHWHACDWTCGLNAGVYGHGLVWIQMNMAYLGYEMGKSSVAGSKPVRASPDGTPAGLPLGSRIVGEVNVTIYVGHKPLADLHETIGPWLVLTFAGGRAGAIHASWMLAAWLPGRHHAVK